LKDPGDPGSPPSLPGLFLYFLRLGALGFGGPVALANAMRRDLVEARGWITELEYDRGLAIAAVCPGPLAYQLAVYCGYVRFGVAGGLAVAVSFALAPFLLVVGAARLYVRYSDAWQVRALFYGVAPVVVALIVKACWNLGEKTLGRRTRAWTVFLLACGITVVLQRELVAVFLAAGILGAFFFLEASPPRSTPPAPKGGGVALPLSFGVLSAGPSGIAGELFFFFKTGLLVFGSGLVIVPFLKTYVVDQYHWLGNRQFLDAVAIGMISPGPVVISATVVGYLLDGLEGATAASVGIFAPAVLFTILATPVLLRHTDNRRLRGFLRGITLAVVGVLVGTTYLVGRTAIGDVLTAAIAVGSLLALFRFRRLSEPVLVAAGALVGLLAYPILRPAWLLR